MPRINRGGAKGKHVYPAKSKGGGFSSTIGALREKALAGAPRKPVNLPLVEPKKGGKPKIKPSLIWSATRYKEGQRKK